MKMEQTAWQPIYLRPRSRSVSMAALLGLGMLAGLLHTPPPASAGFDDEQVSRRRIDQGLAIAPVPLDIAPRKRRVVGNGSYIVNAQSVCADCHSCPTYAPGHSPFMGGDGQQNNTTYLAGGVPFGPITSPNITPDAQGNPAGLSPEEFVALMRTGHDPDGPPGGVLQIMPWAFFRNMTDRDLLAIYEYLRSIPHAETPPPGTCQAPGQ